MEQVPHRKTGVPLLLGGKPGVTADTCGEGSRTRSPRLHLPEQLCRSSCPAMQAHRPAISGWRSRCTPLLAHQQKNREPQPPVCEKGRPKAAFQVQTMQVRKYVIPLHYGGLCVPDPAQEGRAPACREPLKIYAPLPSTARRSVSRPELFSASPYPGTCR